MIARGNDPNIDHVGSLVYSSGRHRERSFDYGMRNSEMRNAELRMRNVNLKMRNGEFGMRNRK